MDISGGRPKNVRLGGGVRPLLHVLDGVVLEEGDSFFYFQILIFTYQKNLINLTHFKIGFVSWQQHLSPQRVIELIKTMYE